MFFNIQKIVLKLFYSSSHWILKLSFFLLPFALLFSLTSFLFLDSVFISYKNYLKSSYLGSLGRLSVESTNKDFINDLPSFSKKENFIYSNRKIYKTNIVFQSENKKIIKYAKFIVLDLKYLNKKFNKNIIKDNTFFINQVFYKSMGSLNIENYKNIFYKEKENAHFLEDIIKIDTGFLGSEPIIYLSESFAKKLFPNIKYLKEEVEFLERNEKNITFIKDNIHKLSSFHKVFTLKINDLIIDSKNTNEFLSKVSYLQYAIFLLIFLLILGVLILSISISLEFKKKSLNILHLLGMSIRDLCLSLSFSIFLIVLAMFIFAIFILPFVQNVFLELTSFPSSFFLKNDLDSLFYIFLLIIVLSISSFFISKFIFESKK